MHTNDNLSWRVVCCALLGLTIASPIALSRPAEVSYGALTGARASEAPDAQDAPDYRGRILGQSGGTVNIWTERRPSGRTEVDIEFVGLEQVCESGPRLGDFLLGTDDVTAERRFEALVAAGTELSLNDIDLNLAEGQLLPKGRARGYVFTYHDPFDPPGGEFNQDECATDGKVRWQARKVDHREQGKTLAGTSARRSGQAPGRAEVASASKERYEGYLGLRDDGSDFVSLDVERESGGGKVSFQTEFNLSCDSADRRLTLGPIRARLDRNGHFRQALYAETRSPRHRYFTWVRGDLLPGGKAKGVIAYVDDPWDPKGSVNESECGYPLVTWKATRGPSASPK
jgi:hypothetical protein